MVFEDFKMTTPLLNALIDMEFIQPTPIQQKAFSPILSGKDVVGIAQTGTGKTLAYLLPILSQLKFAEQRQPRVLIIVPTRELVKQQVDEIKRITKYMSVRFAGVYGGANINTQKQIVYDGLDILVGTPGRIFDLAMTGILRFQAVQKLVIDEVDEMLNSGFRPQLVSIIELLPPKRQNLMFSATLSADVETIINDFFDTPLKIEIMPHGTPLEKIVQRAYYVPNFFTKANLLEYLLNTDISMEKVLVFAESKKLADRLAEHLEKKGISSIGVIHSNKSQNLRFNTLERFQTGEHKVLIATDIAARGLDITDVSHVINFDTPEMPIDYIHRIGRTGRAEKEGVAITFINNVERAYQLEIENLMKIPIPIEELPQAVHISEIFTDEEKPKTAGKQLVKIKNIKNSKGAFHEKKGKNKKVNFGGPSKTDPKKAKFAKKNKRKKT